MNYEYIQVCALFYLVKQSFKCEVLLYKTFLTNIKGLGRKCVFFIFKVS